MLFARASNINNNVLKMLRQVKLPTLSTDITKKLSHFIAKETVSKESGKKIELSVSFLQICYIHT